MSKGVPMERVISELSKDPEYRKAERAFKPRFDILKAILMRRVDLGISQETLAQKANTHQSRISRIESADYDIRLGTLVNIAEALECEVCIQLVPFGEDKYRTIPLPTDKLDIEKSIEIITEFNQNPIASSVK